MQKILLRQMSCRNAGAFSGTFHAIDAVMILKSVAASDDERTRRLPGDELIPDPIGQLTHAITINRPRQDVWPWLVQMGAGTRGGWYSYDRLDNGGHPSATRVLPYLQQIRVGMLFPALPGRTDGFHVLALDSGVSLVLGFRAPDGSLMTTWTFVLGDAGNSTTRLITRSRASTKYPFLGSAEIDRRSDSSRGSLRHAAKAAARYRTARRTI